MIDQPGNRRRDSRFAEALPGRAAVLWTLLSAPITWWRERRDASNCPFCQAPVAGKPFRCVQCGADLQTALFQDRLEHVSLEGIVLYCALILILASTVWIRMEPLIYRIEPGFRATKRGPSGFPVTVEIRPNGLGITNGSDENWTCKVVIGRRPIYAATLSVEAHKSADVLYSSFGDGLVAPDADVGYLRAREIIGLDCKDRSGRSHSIAF